MEDEGFYVKLNNLYPSNWQSQCLHPYYSYFLFKLTLDPRIIRLHQNSDKNKKKELLLHR